MTVKTIILLTLLFVAFLQHAALGAPALGASGAAAEAVAPATRVDKSKLWLCASCIPIGCLKSNWCYWANRWRLHSKCQLVNAWTIDFDQCAEWEDWHCHCNKM